MRIVQRVSLKLGSVKQHYTAARAASQQQRILWEHGGPAC